MKGKKNCGVKVSLYFSHFAHRAQHREGASAQTVFSGERSTAARKEHVVECENFVLELGDICPRFNETNTKNSNLDRVRKKRK